MSLTAADFKQRKQALLLACANAQSLPRASQVRKHLRQLSLLCDESLLQLWQAASMPTEACLVAVGGYGRQALFPYSDVDVLVLLPDGLSPHDNPGLQTAIERFIGSCWDAGLEIGSSVRNLQECIVEAAGDITVQTSMLEARRIGGDEALFQAFSQGFHKHLEPRAFFTGKTLEMQQRHTKFANTPYSLEPNCKESPGGLRDLQMLLWLAKASGLGESWKDLGLHHMVTPLELRQLQRNEDLLSLIRWRLHYIAHRREDRLVFDLQTSVSQDLGLAPPEGEQRHARRASEALMKHYYWAAKAVTQLNQIVHLNMQEWLFEEATAHPPRPLNAFFADKSGM